MVLTLNVSNFYYILVLILSSKYQRFTLGCKDIQIGKSGFGIILHLLFEQIDLHDRRI